MKRIHRFSALLCALALLLGTPMAWGPSASAVEVGDTITEGSYTAKVNDDGTGVILTGISSALQERLVLPDSLGGLPVTEIAAGFFTGPGGYSMNTIVIPQSVTAIAPTAFNGYRTKSVSAFETDPENTAFEAEDGVLFQRGDSGNTLVAYPQAKTDSRYAVPDGVTAIGGWAFYGAKNLATLTLPDGLTSIGSNGFSASGLTALSIPGSVTDIGEGVFSSCDSFSEITLAMKKIPDKLFYMSKGLVRVTLADTVEEIGSNAFYNCDQLTAVEIPDSVKTIGRSAFYDCDQLAGVKLGAGLTAIDSYAFYSCGALTEIDFPAALSTIGDHAFSSCGLTALALPDCITAIQSEVFGGNAFTELTLSPSAVAALGEYAFSNCKQLTRVTIEPGAVQLPNGMFSGCTALSRVDLPDSLTGIGNGVFSTCTSLKEIALPEHLTSLGTSAFKSTPLVSVDLPDGIQNLKASTFEMCGQLTTVHLPAQLKAIDSFAFGSCRALQSITIPPQVTDIYGTAFNNCFSLLEVVFQGDAPANVKSNPFPQNLGLKFYRPDGAANYDKAPWTGMDFETGLPEELPKLPIQIKLTASLAHSRQDDLILWLTADITPRTYDGENNPISPAGALTTYIQVEGEEGALPEAHYYLGGNTSTFRTFGYSVEQYQDKTITVYVTMGESIGFQAGQSAPITGAVGKLSDLPWDVDKVFGNSDGGAHGFDNETFVTQSDPNGTGGLIITALDARSSTAESVTIPAAIDGKDVTALDRDLFLNCVNLRSITIPATVTTIGANCFQGCISLEQVTFLGDAPDLSGAAQPFPAKAAIHITREAAGFDQAPWTDMDLWYPLVASTLTATAPTMEAGGNKLALKMTAALGPDNYYGDTSNAPKLSDLRVSMDTYAVTNLNIAGDGTLTFEAPWFLSGKEVVLKVRYEGDGRYYLAAVPYQTKLQLPAFYTAPSGGGSSGGGGGGGGGGSSTAGTSQENKTDGKTQEPAVNVVLTDQAVQEAVKAAQQGEAVVLKADAPEEAKAVEVTVPAALLDSVSQSEGAGVSLQTPVANISLDAKVLEALQADGKQDVVVSAGQAAAEALPEAVRESLADRPVYDISITAGGKAVSQFGGGTVTVALPYTPAPGEEAAALAACWVAEDGTTQVVRESMWKDGALVFATPHLSTYAIVHSAGSFSDTAGHWAQEDIRFSTARELMLGMGDGQFQPDAPVTGAMAAAVLGRLAGVEDAPEARDWAAPHLEWAGNSGLLPDGFAPDAPLPREQLAYLLARSLGGRPEAGNLPVYTDQSSVTAGYLEDIQYVQQLGLMQGREDGTFDPQGSLTRGELTAVLRRLILLKLG